jgi:hypothetical protein
MLAPNAKIARGDGESAWAQARASPWRDTLHRQKIGAIREPIAPRNQSARL